MINIIVLLPKLVTWVKGRFERTLNREPLAELASDSGRQRLKTIDFDLQRIIDFGA